MKKSLGPKILIYPSPVWCIGSYDEKGIPNVMTASWAGIVCSDPPSVAVSLRKATHTYGNLMRSKAFTVSVPSRKYAREADYFGLVSGKNINKFEAMGLTPVKADRVNAPYVGEFPMVVECQLIHTFELGFHTQFVGEIVDVKVEDAFLSKNGLPDMGKLDPFLYCAGEQSYYSTGERFGEAFKIGKK